LLKPNIVYLHSHDTGRFIQPYGYAVETPALQRFAAEGVVFRQAFAVAPNCSPSRAALLTGEYPHNNGMHGLDHRGGFVLNDYRRHLLHTLRDNGYATVLGGLQHIGLDTDAIGFDRVLGNARSPRAAAVVPRVVSFLEQAPDQPFFLDCGIYETHKEQRLFASAPESPDTRFTAPPPTLPDTAETRLEMARFGKAVTVLDNAFGTVLQALEANGLADNTLVIVTTDHGLPLAGHKCTLSDGGAGVMLMMRGPGGFSGGRVIGSMVSQLDVFPTLCDLLQISPPQWLQGSSLLPLVRGEREQIHDAVFSELTYHTTYTPLRAVRTNRWKYIRSFADASQRHFGGDPGPAVDQWDKEGGPKRFLAEEQLYDLLFDPGEACNLADDAEYGKVLGEMRTRLERWQRDTDDPLLKGDIPPVTTEGLNGPIPTAESQRRRPALSDVVS
jgi:N-sulfoglucosamine sulfohydrolase